MTQSSAVPSLTDRQILTLGSILQQLMVSPEVGAAFLVDPRPVLLQLNMTEDDVVQIVNYFKYIQMLVEKDHGDDWI